MKAVIFAAVVGANLASAQIGIECSGNVFPNWDDCDAVMDHFEFRDNTDVVAYNGQDGPEPSCTWWFWEDGNCRISTCWTVTNQYARDNGYGGERLEDTGDNIGRAYDGIRNTCQKLRAGGTWRASENIDGKSWAYTEVTNDPDQSPPSAKLRKPAADRFIKKTVSLEEHQAWVNETEAKAVAARKKRDAAILHHKREDDDDEYYINNSGTYVRQDGVYDVGPRASNGVTTEYSTTNSKSFTSSASVNIGGAFKMFTADIGFEYSETDTFSITKGITFTPECEGNQQGQAFFYPFFDYYDVTFSPSGQRADLWIPVPEGDMFIAGEIDVQCLG